ncbi:MAG: glycosyltransferase [Thermoanaerobaculia bacterium]
MLSLALLSPLPPARSGIADYTAMLLPGLAARFDLTCVVNQPRVDEVAARVIPIEEFEPGGFDRVVCQMGNNPYHEFVYRYAIARPSIVVLHDFVLQHLIVEMTLARGDAEGYMDILERNHGAAGRAWAASRVAGIHEELGNFLFPSSIELAASSQAVIVHNRWAAERLEEYGVRAPIHVIGHPHLPLEGGRSREEVRRALGARDDERWVGMFGFVTAAKRPEVVFEAFARAHAKDANLRLLVVGEPSPNIDLQRIAHSAGLAPDVWNVTGYVSDLEFVESLAAVDRIVNLRYPTAGETSGPLIKILAAGKPVAVSDYAQFGELPRAVVSRIPFGEGEIPSLVEFMLDDEDRDEARAARRKWVELNASLERAVDDYTRIIRDATDGPVGRSRPAGGGWALFPHIAVNLIEAVAGLDGRVVRISVRNEGNASVRSALWGEPGYRLVLKALSGETVLFDRWIALPGDLAPDSVAELELSIPLEAELLTLEHALEGIPTAPAPPFARLEIPR